MGSEALLLSWANVFGLHGAPRRDALRARSQEVGGQHIALRRLVDGLHRVLLEQVVAPGDQVVQVLHHHAVLIGQMPRPRDRVGLEWLVENRLIAVQHVSCGCCRP